MNEDDVVEARYSIIEFFNSVRKWLWYIYEELLRVVEPGLRELVNNAWDRQSIFLFTSETILFKLSREIVCDIWYYDKLSFASSDYGSKIVWEM